jgi:uncharacterized protein (TIGR03382 family)
MKRSLGLSLAPFVVAALVGMPFLAAPAGASPIYPTAMQDKLQLADPPSCTVCHRDLAGGAGTVVQPFGVELLQNRGLFGGSDVESLEAALDSIAADGHDSDEDGESDVDELKAGTDPNAAGGGVATPVQFGFGCAAAGMPSSLAGLAVALAFLSRRRKARA